ncbi:MAG: cellulosome anchor protein [Firmicutes bacterium]|nr:cellulosome anchor protein [Bacillota bacterium]
MPRALLALVLIVITSLVTPLAADAVESEGLKNSETVSISNEYIRIVVNAEGENTGRFALETTGGDPDRTSDDGEPLIYGRPKPWTSYTTVRVDDEDYVFGGKTTKRAGLSGKYGEVVSGPEVQGDGIEITAKLGPVEVLQRLEFAVSSTTGYRDSARIIYRITNTDAVPHEVGLRIMLDTLLGANDGAPFRFHEEAILGDAEYQGDELPDFWQAFDSLSDPRVIAQGTLKGPDVTTPDRIIFSNWGSFADGLWEIDFQPGREFLRLGEFELDSAVGLYWEPATLLPGESRTYVTGYGMGGLSISPGELSLGVTSPATVALDKDGRARIPVVAYLENTGEGIGRELTITLKAPSGMAFSPDTPPSRIIGFLRPGKSTQASWVLVADRRLAGRSVSLRVEVKGPDIDTVAVERRLKILGPPELDFELTGYPKENSDYYVLEASLANEGQSSAYNVEAVLELPEGWEAAPLEKTNRFLGELKPVEGGEGQVIRWQWQVKPMPFAAQPELAAKVTSTNTDPITERLRELSLPQPMPKIFIAPVSEAYVPGDLVEVAIKALDIQGFSGLRLVLAYNPQQLAFLDYSRGHLWVDATGQPYEFSVNHNPHAGQIILEGKIPAGKGIYTGKGDVVQLRFLALAPGISPIKVVETPLLYSSVADQDIALEVIPITVKEQGVGVNEE